MKDLKDQDIPNQNWDEEMEVESPLPAKMMKINNIDMIKPFQKYFSKKSYKEVSIEERILAFRTKCNHIRDE